MDKRYRLVLWGIGKDYNKYVNLLKYAEKAHEIEVVAVTANDLPNVRTVDKWNVIDRNMLNTIEFDYILVMSVKYYTGIIQDILSLGIARKRIIPCKVLDIPYFSWKSYIDILQTEISIISNNCWGGILYNTLGMECRSPFKNLFVQENDFLRMLTNLPHYLSIKPIMERWGRDLHSGQVYPIMKIDDVEIHFNHDSSVQDALEKWNRRCKKVNYDNLFISMYTEDDSIAEQFLKLDQYLKKICFVPYKEGNSRWQDVKNVYELELLPGQTEFWETVNSNVSNGRNGMLLNILGMLAMDKQYRVERY